YLVARPQRSSLVRFSRSVLQDAAADLVEFDTFEQGFEIALAKAFVALALDELEEDRPERVLGEDLQEQALAFGARTVHEDAALTQLLYGLAMAGQARVDEIEIRFDRILERNATRAQAINCVVEIVAPQRDVLDALAAIALQIFLDLIDLAGLAFAFIQR